MYVTLGDNFEFEYNSTFSISFWAKWTTASIMDLVAKQADTTFQGYAVYADASGHVGCQLVNTVGGNLYLDVVTTTTYKDGVWHHICVTYDGSHTAAGVLIYVDGTSQTKTTNKDLLGTNTIVTTNALYFGGRASSGSNQYYTGSMDEVAFYNITLSSAQVTALYNGKDPTNLLIMTSPSSSNLTGWWRMGDGDTAPTITDNSTGGHNGTMTNSPVITADWPTSGTVATDYSFLLRNIKNALKSSTGWTDSSGAAQTLSTPWTVVASSNGTIANSSDNWTTNADIVFAAAPSAHSWIVLRQTGINGQNVDICFDCGYSSSAYQINMVTSFGAGFNVTSPVTTARPTATDEVVQIAGSWFNVNSSFNAVLNFCVTDDGYRTRFWCSIAGTCKGWWLIDKPKVPVTGWTNPVVIYVSPSTSPLYTSANDNPYASIRANNTNGLAYFSCEFYNLAAVGQNQTTVNSLTSEWPMNRVGIASNTAGLYGRVGELSDAWWTSTTPAVGDTFPASGTLKQFIVIPNMVLPWNQSTPVLT